MKLTVTSDKPINKTSFRPGSRGYAGDEVNSLIFIGEDDMYLWTILDSNGMYYGVRKAPENLAALHVTAAAIECSKNLAALHFAAVEPQGDKTA